MVDILKDQELVVLQKEAGNLEQRAQSFLVASDQSYEEAGGIISWIAQARKKIEERRKFFVKPLNDHIKEINEMFKQYAGPFDKADEIIREKMMNWHRQEEAREKARLAEVEKNAKKIAKETGVAVEEIMAGAEVPEAIKETDKSTISKRWTFEVEVLNKVPREYMSLDERKVNTAIREGARKIPGLRIYQEESIKLK